MKARLLARDYKRAALKAGGIFDRVHGNEFQSGWPGHFLYLKGHGPLWVQVLGPKGVLTPSKIARFKLWSEHGVPLVAIRSLLPFETLYTFDGSWGYTHPADVVEARRLYPELARVGDSIYEQWGPEAEISARLRFDLRRQGWLVQKTHGGAYASGWPDFFLYHPEHGYRWLEMKAPGGKLEPTQVGRFNRWSKSGVGIWVLDSIDPTPLFGPPNWKKAPRKKWGLKELL